MAKEAITGHSVKYFCEHVGMASKSKTNLQFLIKEKVKKSMRKFYKLRRLTQSILN